MCSLFRMHLNCSSNCSISSDQDDGIELLCAFGVAPELLSTSDGGKHQRKSVVMIVIGMQVYSSTFRRACPNSGKMGAPTQEEVLHHDPIAPPWILHARGSQVQT